MLVRGKDFNRLVRTTERLQIQLENELKKNERLQSYAEALEHIIDQMELNMDFIVKASDTEEMLAQDTPTSRQLWVLHFQNDYLLKWMRRERADATGSVMLGIINELETAEKAWAAAQQAKQEAQTATQEEA